jgi:hypothetical protein
MSYEWAEEEDDRIFPDPNKDFQPAIQGAGVDEVHTPNSGPAPARRPKFGLGKADKASFNKSGASHRLPGRNPG